MKLYLRKIKVLCRNMYNKHNRKKLKNHEFTILSSNCVGACIAHDLGEQFRSPFVNLWMKPKDFLKYIKDIKHYSSAELKFITKPDISYPVGSLDDIEIYFMHYESQTEAYEKWNERTKRINMDHLFILMVEQNGCTVDDMKEFDELPYQNKILLSHKPYPKFQSVYYLKGFETMNELGNCIDYKSSFSFHKYYDSFPYVEWLNSSKEMYF